MPIGLGLVDEHRHCDGAQSGGQSRAVAGGMVAAAGERDDAGK